jgi:hypothetical protein
MKKVIIRQIGLGRFDFMHSMLWPFLVAVPLELTCPVPYHPIFLTLYRYALLVRLSDGDLNA